MMSIAIDIEQQEIEKAWAEEVLQRLANYDSGDAESYDALEVLAEARSLLK